ERPEPRAVGDHRDLRLQDRPDQRRLQHGHRGRPVQLRGQSLPAAGGQLRCQADHRERTVAMSVLTTSMMSRLRRKPAATKIREPFRDRVFLVVVTIMLTVVLALVLLPVVYIVASSFSSAAAVSAGRVSFWPVEFSLHAYRVALTNPQVLQGYY